MPRKRIKQLYDYQEECLHAIEKAGDGRHVVAIATGLGKTVIFSHIKRSGRTLILSHRDELVHQPEQYYDCSYGVEKAGEHSNGEEVVSASIQTLSSDQRLMQFSPDDFDTIIVDECHHAAAPTYKKVLNYFTGTRRVLGFTATPKRGDGVKLNDIFDDIIFSRDLKWGIDHGYLTRLRSVKATADFNLSAVSKLAGDYSPEALEQVLLNGNALAVTAQTFLHLAYEQGKHTLLYCVSKHMCFLLLDMIRKELPDNEKQNIQVITGDTPSDERSDILRKFASGEIKAIINCMVLTEGTDLPIADCIVNMRPTCNDSLYQQIIGRGTRLSKDKSYCLVIDILPEDGKGRDLCSAPTLFGIDPNILDKETAKKTENGTGDLLDICNAITSSMDEITKDLDVRIESTNIFLDEYTELMKDSGNIKRFAERFAQLQCDRSAEQEWNFLGMDVTIQAEDEKRYKIKPNWDDMIYLSEPDLLGNTKLEIKVSDAARYGFGGRHYFRKEMPMDDAILFARNYCEIQDGRYRFSWDLNTQKAWLHIGATQRQKEMIAKCYGAMVDLDGINEMDKLSASRIIQLRNEIGERQDLKKLLETAAKPRKSKAKERAEKELELRDKILLSDKQQGEKDFDAFARKVEKIHANDDQMVIGSEQDTQLSIPLSYEFYANRGKTCTEKQMHFINEMLSQLKEEGVAFTDLNRGIYTARQASVVITILKNIQNRYREQSGVTVTFESIKELLDKIENGEKPQSVSLSYQLQRRNSDER